MGVILEYQILIEILLCRIFGFMRFLLRNIQDSGAYRILKRYWHLKEERFVFFTFLMSPFIFFFIEFGGLKIFFAFYLFISLVIYLKLKSGLITLFITYLFTSQFVLPAKTYYAVAISYLYNPIFDFKAGYLKDYGINTSNIMLVLLLLLLFRRSFGGIYKYFFKNRFVIIVILCLLVFIFAGFFSSYNYSPYFSASLLWLIQYSQVFVTALMIYLVYKYYKNKFSLIIYTVLSISVFQSVLSLLQFVRQSWLGLIIEGYRVVQISVENIDLIGNIYRVPGTFNHPNQLGLIVLLLLCVLLPYVFTGRNMLFNFSAILLFITLLLTQSRSSWLGFLSILLVCVCFYFNKTKLLFVKFIKNKRYVLYFCILLVLVSYVIVPRILLSTTVFYESGGAFELRKTMLLDAIELVRGSYLFGYGPGTNEYILYNIQPDGYVKYFPGAVHNGFIQLILEVGLMGFSAFILPFITIKYLIIRRIILKRAGVQSKAFAFTFISGFLAFFIFYLFQSHWGQYDFVFLGLILGFGMIYLNSNEK